MKDETKTTFRLKAGVSYKIAEKVDFIGKGAYKSTDNFKTDPNVGAIKVDLDELAVWSFLFGVRYRF